LFLGEVSFWTVVNAVCSLCQALKSSTERAGDSLFLGMAETDEEKLEILGDDFSSI
jgi:hypothetical protein